jgi:periplasmic iron binding protein
VLNRWAGPLIAALIVGGVALIVVLNLDLKGASSRSNSPTAAALPTAPATPEKARPGIPKGSGPVAGFREYPIGEPQLRNAMQVAAVWLPPVGMEGMGEALGSDVIHLEADIRATEGNRNGFAKDEFVPYLKVAYSIVPTSGGPPIEQGEMMPMVARDGLHYGASVLMPRAGSFRLIYRILPPSSGGLGRHTDPVTGVAPWWEPFEVSFDWDYPGPPGAG